MPSRATSSTVCWPAMAALDNLCWTVRSCRSTRTQYSTEVTSKTASCCSRHMPEATDASGRSPAVRGTILYEAHNLTIGSGTGIATYARELALAAGRLGYNVHGLFGVERGLARGEDHLNEVL